VGLGEALAISRVRIAPAHSARRTAWDAQKMSAAISKIAKQAPKATVIKSLASMKGRCQLIIKAKGGNIKM